LTHFDVYSQGLAAFGHESQGGDEEETNLKLDVLEKVFDLFHTVTVTEEEVVPQSSLQRLKAMELQKAQGSSRSGPRQSTRTVQRKTIKSHTFAEVQIDEVFGLDTCIPHLAYDQSVFFNGYSSD